MTKQIKTVHDNSYIALYPIQIYELSALYIINFKPLDNQKSTSTSDKCIHQHHQLKQTKSHDETNKKKNKKKKPRPNKNKQTKFKKRKKRKKE